MDAQDFGRYPDHVGHSSKVMGKVRTHAKERPRMHPMKRHKVKDWGNRLGAPPWPGNARALFILAARTRVHQHGERQIPDPRDRELLRWLFATRQHVADQNFSRVLQNCSHRIVRRVMCIDIPLERLASKRVPMVRLQTHQVLSRNQIAFAALLSILIGSQKLGAVVQLCERPTTPAPFLPLMFPQGNRSACGAT